MNILTGLIKDTGNLFHDNTFTDFTNILQLRFIEVPKEHGFGIVLLFKTPNLVISNKITFNILRTGYFHIQCSVPHCGTSESEITFLVEPHSEGHLSFDDREELPHETLETPAGEVFVFSTVEMDLL
jgi:hypothetical protein